jgi:hypothetical protein
MIGARQRRGETIASIQFGKGTEMLIGRHTVCRKFVRRYQEIERSDHFTGCLKFR